MLRLVIIHLLDTPSRDVMLFFYFASLLSGNGNQLLKNKSLGGELDLLKVNPMLVWLCCPGKQIGRHIIVSLSKLEEKHVEVRIRLKVNKASFPKKS